MSVIVTRAGKGTTLSWVEADANFINLNNDKLEAGTPATNIAVTPTGGIVATDVQAAIIELGTEKEPAFTVLPFSKGGTGATSRAAAIAALGVEAGEIAVTTAANATTDINVNGSNILLTTTVATITGFAAAAAGVRRKVRVSTGGITLTNSASFVLPGGANIVAAAGDCFEAESLGGGTWVITQYQPASGKSVVAPESFVAGTALIFAQAAAPTGWTKSTTHNDKSLRVVSGSGGGSGGVQAFSTVFGLTATDASSLSVAQLAAHNHNLISVSGTNSSYPQGLTHTVDDDGSSSSIYRTTTSAPKSSITGSGDAHSHGLDLRVQYVDVIICAKD